MAATNPTKYGDTARASQPAKAGDSARASQPAKAGDSARASQPAKAGDALVYSGFTVPIPDDLKVDPNSDWLTKRYISNIRLKIKELEEEIEQNLKDIDVTSKLCPPGTPGYGWVVELQSQNARMNARIKTLKDEITPP